MWRSTSANTSKVSSDIWLSLPNVWLSIWEKPTKDSFISISTRFLCSSLWYAHYEARWIVLSWFTNLVSNPLKQTQKQHNVAADTFSPITAILISGPINFTEMAAEQRNDPKMKSVFVFLEYSRDFKNFLKFSRCCGINKKGLVISRMCHRMF